MIGEVLFTNGLILDYYTLLYDGITNCGSAQLILFILFIFIFLLYLFLVVFYYYINSFICLPYMYIKLICVIRCDLSDLDDLSDLGDMSDLCDLCDLHDILDYIKVALIS